MPPAIIAAAVGIAASAAAAASVISITTALVITIAASTAAALLTKTKVPSLSAYTSQQERKQVLRSSSAPQVVIYGTTVVSGLLFFAEEQKGDQDENEWLHLAIAIAGHEINSVGRVWLGDETIDTFGEYASYEVHNNRTTVDPYMKSKCPSWKDDMIGKGICWLRVSLKFNQDKFPSGLPNIKAEVFGRKVFDPRLNKNVWSNNASLCIRDFYVNECGVPLSDLNDAQFIAAANICDQLVTTPTGSRKRYTIDGAFDMTDAQSSVLDDMHKACAGEPTYMAGTHGIIVGAYTGSGSGNNMRLDAGQIISDVKIVPEAAYAEKLNVVTGTFLDPEQQYTEVDYPPVSVQRYIDEDGAEFTDDAKFRFVANEYQAQQLAQIKINRTRIGRTLTFTMNLSGYRYRPGYYVDLYLPQLGINGQEFRITEWSLNGQKGVDVTLRQETPEMWDDIIGQPIERPDITDFPTARVAQPINLAYTVTEIGEVVQGVLSWTNIGQISYNIVTIRQNGKNVLAIQVPSESTPLTGLVRGSYEASVVAVNQLGMRSAEAMTIIEIHAPAKPSKVDIEQGFFSITLKPKLAEITNVSTQFDFWTSGESKLNDSNTATVEANATRAGIGQIWLSNNLQNGHTYYWYIRTINAFGTSAFLEVAALCEADIGDLNDYIDQQIQQSGAYEMVNDKVNQSVESLFHDAIAIGGNTTRQWAQFGSVSAEIISVSTTIADVDQALTQLATKQSSDYDNLNASILSVSKTVADNSKAISEIGQTVEASLEPLENEVDNLTATVSTKMTSEVTLEGTAKAGYVVNLGINRGGQYYGAGMGISIDPSGSSYKSSVVFKADQFGIYSGSDASAYKLAFAVYNGQVFITDAMIRDASITNAKIANASINRGKITDSLQSDNYVANQTGMYLNFANGSIAINGTVSGQGRLVIANNRIVAYDTSGNPVAVMGQRL